MSTYRTLIRRLPALAVAAALAAAMPAVAETIGPQGESATPSQTVTVSDAGAAQLKGGGHTAALLWHDQSDFVNAVTAGATDEFDRLGIDVIATTNAAFDAAKQRSDIETALVKQPSIILALPLDPVTSAEAFRAAVADGVKLVFLSNLPSGYEHGVDYAAIVTDDLFQMGKQAADALAEAMGGAGTVGWIFHDATYYVTNQRDNAFKTTIENDYPDISIVAEQGISDPARAEEIANAMLLRHPDLGGVYVTWAGPAEGVLASLRARRQQDHPDRHPRSERADRARHGAGRQRRGHRRRRGLRARAGDGSRRRARAARRGDAAVRGRARDHGHRGQRRRGLADVPEPRCTEERHGGKIGAARNELPAWRCPGRTRTACPAGAAAGWDDEAGLIGRPRLIGRTGSTMAGRFRRAIAFGLRNYDPRNYVVYLGFLAIFVFFTVTLGRYGFTSVRNLSNIVLQTAPATVLAVGSGVRPVGRRDRPVVRLDRRRIGPGRRGRPGRAAFGVRGHRRPGRGDPGGAAERRAGRVCSAAVLPGDTGHPRAVSLVWRAR